MREFLVTKFICAICGRVLQLSTRHPDGMGGVSQYAEGEPTGAAKVEQLVGIEPCECCTRPLEEMRFAVKTLLGQ